MGLASRGSVALMIGNLGGCKCLRTGRTIHRLEVAQSNRLNIRRYKHRTAPHEAHAGCDHFGQRSIYFELQVRVWAFEIRHILRHLSAQPILGIPVFDASAM